MSSTDSSTYPAHVFPIRPCRNFLAYALPYSSCKYADRNLFAVDPFSSGFGLIAFRAAEGDDLRCCTATCWSPGEVRTYYSLCRHCVDAQQADRVGATEQVQLVLQPPGLARPGSTASTEVPID
jgi:hypothetical protein